MNTSLSDRVATDTAAIKLTSVRKHYGQLPAVRGLDLEIQRGETVALLGPNGAGKSTTIGMLMGLVTPDSGAVAIYGRSPRRAVAEGQIAAMLQDSGLMPGVTVVEHLELARRSFSNPLSIAEALEVSGLASVAKRRADRLSGGQAQRVRFAMVVIANPQVLILDEPTRALDVQGRAEFWTTMRAYSATGRTVLFATHYLDEVNENASRVIVMAHGDVVVDGDPADVRKAAGASTVRFTLHGTGPSAEYLPGVTSMIEHSGRISLSSTNPDETVSALVTSGIRWSDLEVTPPSLDESFLFLTKESS
jgi:ABC-2 type transport system ATP-binding protein